MCLFLCHALPSDEGKQMVTHLQLTLHAHLTVQNHYLQDQILFSELPSTTSPLPNSKLSSQSRQPCPSPTPPLPCVLFLALKSEGSMKCKLQVDLDQTVVFRKTRSHAFWSISGPTGYLLFYKMLTLLSFLA